MLLKATRTAILTIAALDDLVGVDECCPICCGKCWVLRDMYSKNDLNKTVLKSPARFYESSSWWDSKHDSVNVTWLTSKWLNNSCTHGLADEEEEIAPVEVAGETAVA